MKLMTAFCLLAAAACVLYGVWLYLQGFHRSPYVIGGIALLCVWMAGAAWDMRGEDDDL